MKARIALLYILTIFLFGCDRNNELNQVAITNFNLDSTQLTVREPVRLLYCSSKNNKNPNRSYMIQFVAIRIKNNDTINILAYSSYGIKNKTDGDKIFYCIPNENSDHIIKSVNIEKENIKNGDLKNLIDGNIIFVVQDKEYNEIQENNYPTFISELEQD